MSDSITDIDATEAGEVELDLGAGVARSLSGTSATWQSTVEVEWRALRWLGFNLEGTLGAQRQELTFDPPRVAGLQLGMAIPLLRDFRRELYLQVELAGRLLSQVDLPVEAGEPSLPYSALLRVGKRWGHGTLRGALGGSFEDPRVPSGRALFAQGAWLMEVNRLGTFYGLESSLDWGLHPVTTVAPEVEIGLGPRPLPFRIAFALPWVYDGGQGRSWFGGFVRIIGEFDSDKDD